jgi:TRAP-type mannitol/chloroaromatic compound transport system permease small subunit
MLKTYTAFTSFLNISTQLALIALVLNMFLIVVFRYFFSTGWVWLQELCLYLHAYIFLMGCIYTLRKNQHVRVDILYEKINKRRVNLFGALLFGLPFFTLILFTSLEFTKQSWKWLEGSADSQGLPIVFILKTFIPFFALLMIFELFFSHILKKEIGKE